MKTILKAVKITVILLLLVSAYQVASTYFVTAVAQITMPDKANGSLLYVDGQLVGSELIGQSFTSPGYFHGRPSAKDYEGHESAGSNLGPTSAKLMEQVSQRVEQVRRENGLAADAPVPADLVLASASGLDPHISVKSAMLQVPRVANTRGLPEAVVRSLVNGHIEPPQFGILGAEKVNVLKLNLALDKLTRGN
ncbi:MAG: potassium-transporting ATPase subunit KdpC [Chloroflexota bacterium]|nr:potassium-transporting ATPase subunit KdpC [Chloroflexota bacterium]